MGATRHIMTRADAKSGTVWADQEENLFMHYCGRQNSKISPPLTHALVSPPLECGCELQI